MMRTVYRLALAAAAVVLTMPTDAHAVSAGSADQPHTVREAWSADVAAGLLPFDCRLDGDGACLVRIANANGRAATLYRYQFDGYGRPTADVRLALNQATEDDRYISEQGPATSEGAWDCRWNGDDKCVGRLGGVRYVFPFQDGSPARPYVSAWQG
jgi:hypothetical protein